MAEATTLEKPRRFAALQHRNFTLLWSGLIVSNAGTWMQNVAQGWLVLQLTNSPLWLGLLGLSFALPMIILPFFGGVTVDRMNRIRLLYITQTGMMATAFILAVLTWLHMVSVYHILAASFIGAVFLAFDNPARQALVPDLVPREDLLNALSLNSATFTGAALIGPAIAGALLGILGAGSLFFINGLSFLAVLFALASMKNVRTHSGGEKTSIKNPFLRGYLMRGNRALFWPFWRFQLLRPFLGVRIRPSFPYLRATYGMAEPTATGFFLPPQAAGRWLEPLHLPLLAISGTPGGCLLLPD